MQQEVAGVAAHRQRRHARTTGESHQWQPCLETLLAAPPIDREVSVLVISVVVTASRSEGTLDYAGVPNKPDRHPQLALLGRQPSAVANRRRGALITQYTPYTINPTAMTNTSAVPIVDDDA